ncbi:MAG: outer membrane protein [Methylocystis sp.]
MKRTVSIAALALALTNSAFAADLPHYKAPLLPPPPPPPLWTGFYAGLNAGYAFGTSNQVNTAAYPILDRLAGATQFLNGNPFITSNFIPGITSLANTGFANVNQNGFIGGGQIGYNYQWGQSFVVGVEADIQGAGIRGRGGYSGASSDRFGFGLGNFVPGVPDFVSLARTAVGSGEITAGIDWMGTVRGRLGWLAMPTLLVYGTGGLAYGGAYASATHSAGGTLSLTFPILPIIPAINFGAPVVPGSGQYSDTRVGWTAGGGFEWMVMPNWSVKAEALYYDLGSATFSSSPVIAISPLGIGGFGGPFIANVPTTRVKFDGVIARVGINYHFNWGAAPIVAKY